LEEANRVADQPDTSPAEWFPMLAAQVARTGKGPLKRQAQTADPVAGAWQQQAATVEGVCRWWEGRKRA